MTGALLLGALLLHWLVARPAARENAAAQAEAARLRREALSLQGQVDALEKALAEEARIVRMDLPEGAPKDAVARLRMALLESLQGQPVSGVRLAVSASSPPAAAKGRVEATGSFSDLVRLSGRLVRPGAGLVLERMTLGPTSRGLTLQVEGVSVEGRAP